MAASVRQPDLQDAVTRYMHQGFTTLSSKLTVGEALEWLRIHPPQVRIVYFYVVDEDGRLLGVLPTRHLLLNSASAKLRDIMISPVIAVPARATVLEACEFFIQHRLLAFPVIDDAGRLLGVVDMELYADQLARLSEAAPVDRWLRPVVQFLSVESSSGLVLLACTVVAMVIANSPWAAGFDHFWHTDVGFAVGDFEFKMSLLHWINKGLMTLFFFVVGLEIKREVVVGELRELRRAALPIVAALGGMVVPALVYLIFHWGRPTAIGWGIPTATDIAFVVGFLALLGPRVPHSLKIMLLSLAIADDIGATLVIAVAYTSQLAPVALAVGAAGFGVVVLLRLIGVRRVLPYVVVGALIWAAFLKSGVHPTVAGVALGLLTPARRWLGERVPLDLAGDLLRRAGIRHAAPTGREELLSPVERLEHGLHPWVAYLIMPVFALANAGVPLEPAGMIKPVALAVAAGLIVGKPLGIALFSWAALRWGLAALPAEFGFRALIGAGCLAGVGFTMSLFIAGLALPGPLLEEAKIGILAGSAVSAGLGCALLLRFLPPRPAAGGPG